MRRHHVGPAPLSIHHLKFKTIMSDTGNFVLQTRKFRYERAIEVDGERTSLIVDVQFNDKDGTFRIIPRQTLKTTSRNPASRMAVSQQIERMREEAVDVCLALNKEWKINNGEHDPEDEDGLANMRRGNQERYEASADAAMADEHGVKWNEDTERYEDAQGNAWNANDGGPDDEKEPGEKELSFTAPAAGKGRKPRSNAPPVEV